MPEHGAQEARRVLDQRDHPGIEGGDFQIPERPKVGLPGARFALDRAAGRYRIAKIFRGDNEEAKYRAPLAEVGVDAREGDYVLAIDCVELVAPDNPYRLLRHKTDPVTLTLNSTPSAAGARQVTYRPLEDESDLLYFDWVEGNRRWVDEKSGGGVGYLHIPDMGAPGAYEFLKWYYPQIRKEGLIVDVPSISRARGKRARSCRCRSAMRIPVARSASRSRSTRRVTAIGAASAAHRTACGRPQAR